MEHHPGNALVSDAKSAIDGGLTVVLYVQFGTDPITLKSIEVAGPFALADTTNGKWIIRLDQLAAIRTYKGSAGKVRVL